MVERLEDMVMIMEDAAYIRYERLSGDPERGPDETTEEDVAEALLRNGLSPDERLSLQKPVTRALRIMIKELTQRS